MVGCCVRRRPMNLEKVMNLAPECRKRPVVVLVTKRTNGLLWFACRLNRTIYVSGGVNVVVDAQVW